MGHPHPITPEVRGPPISVQPPPPPPTADNIAQVVSQVVRQMGATPGSSAGPRIQITPKTPPADSLTLARPKAKGVVLSVQEGKMISEALGRCVKAARGGQRRSGMGTISSFGEAEFGLLSRTWVAR